MVATLGPCDTKPMSETKSVFCHYCKRERDVRSTAAFGNDTFLTLSCKHTIPEPISTSEPKESKETLEIPYGDLGIRGVRCATEDHKLVCSICLLDWQMEPSVELVSNHVHKLVEIETKRSNKFAQCLPFQREGVEFLEKAGYNAILGDEQGLGKTIQTLQALLHNKAELTPTLFVVKPSLILNWVREMTSNEWLCDPTDSHDMPFFVLDGQSTLLPGFRYVVIGYSNLAKYKKEILSYGFRLMVVDEFQNLANMASARTKVMLEIGEKIQYHIMSSGTSVLNRASEYYPALHLVRPREWYDYKSFVRNWLDVETTLTGYTKIRGIHKYRREAFFERTRSYILRRKKRDVLKDLPPFSRNFTIVSLRDSALRNSYNKEASDLDSYINSAEYYKANGASKSTTLLGYLMRMRHIAGLAKIPIAVEQIVEFLENTDPEQKLLVGCIHDDVMLGLRLALENWKPVLLPSGIDDIERTKRIDQFRNGSRLAIAKMLSQGEGLNLQFCSNIFQLERHWNAGKEEQFEARIDRFGQTEPTVADYLIAKDTVDEDFTEMAEEKRRIAGSTLNASFEVETNDSIIQLLAERSAKRRI